MSHYFKSCLLLLTFFMFQKPVTGQEVNKSFCGTEIPSEEWNQAFSKLVAERSTHQSAARPQQIVYTIPVIVHIIHGGQAVGTYPNLPQGQINSQIFALNDDYAGIGFNYTNYPATAFTTWASNVLIPPSNLDANGRVAIADCGIKFVLATMDTLGNLLPEPGIDRINYINRGWSNPASFSSSASFKIFIDNTVKPQTVWNVSKYLNIWVSDSDQNGTGGLLGYATFPPLSGLPGLPGTGTANTDGFWCYAKCMGSATTYPSGNYLSGYNRGRTSTHEIGHWLGLRHIWGDGTCATDYCADTPPASASNFNAPNYPHKANVCTGSVDGEMYMNFMDYTNDPVKYMFTGDQANRIQTAMANSPYRKYLGTHGLANMQVNASFQNSALLCTGVPISLVNTSMGFPAPTYTWITSGSGVFSPNQSVFSPSVVYSSPGIYTVTLAASNGSATSVSTKTFNIVSPNVSLSASSSTVCNGQQLTLTGSGVFSYTWQPGNLVGTTANYAPTQNQTYTCNASQVNGCKATATIAIIVAECTNLQTLTSESLEFNVYPNPAKELLHIDLSGGRSASLDVEIVDALGRTILSRKLQFGAEEKNQSIKLDALSDGLYFVRMKSSDSSTPRVVRIIKQ